MGKIGFVAEIRVTVNIFRGLAPSEILELGSYKTIVHILPTGHFSQKSLHPTLQELLPDWLGSYIPINQTDREDTAHTCRYTALILIIAASTDNLLIKFPFRSFQKTFYHDGAQLRICPLPDTPPIR